MITPDFVFVVTEQAKGKYSTFSFIRNSLLSNLCYTGKIGLMLIFTAKIHYLRHL